MTRKIFFAIIIILLLPIIASAENYSDTLKKIQREIARPVGQGYTVNLSEFRIAQSEGKYYWFVKLANNSSMVIPQGKLKVQASQYDTQGDTQAAGIPIEINMQIDPNRDIQLQREFTPMPGLTSIRVETYQKDINKILSSQQFKATARPVISGVNPEEKQFDMKGVYLVETTVMVDLGDFHLLIWNRGNSTINAKDFTIQTRWEHVFKPDTVEEEKTLPDAEIQPGKYYPVKLTSNYVYRFITDKKIIVNVVNHRENKTYTAEKAIAPPQVTLGKPEWFKSPGHKLENGGTMPSSGVAGLFVTITNHSPYRVSGVLTINVTPVDLDFKTIAGLTSTTTISPPIEPFKSVIEGTYFDYAWPKNSVNNRAFLMKAEMVMNIPYEPVEARSPDTDGIIIKW
ncbi:MAG: hypothetical protein JXC33_07620 [Deltaproteobacteria bacterium]|nr:hypothetical protein [Deltaproteobacteria bacterium]MBN2687054.1 hypothetical protein [Deltaproteobacteria bacterium]